jgi:hypothetical protein
MTEPFRRLPSRLRILWAVRVIVAALLLALVVYALRGLA